MTEPATQTRKDGEFLSTLARGLSVLRSFTKDRPEMTLSEVATATELNPAVARRCLHTLVELGYVGRKGKSFLLTPEVMGFASAFLESMNLEEVVRPHLQRVRDRSEALLELADVRRGVRGARRELCGARRNGRLLHADGAREAFCALVFVADRHGEFLGWRPSFGDIVSGDARARDRDLRPRGARALRLQPDGRARGC